MVSIDDLGGIPEIGAPGHTADLRLPGELRDRIATLPIGLAGLADWSGDDDVELAADHLDEGGGRFAVLQDRREQDRQPLAHRHDGGIGDEADCDVGHLLRAAAHVAQGDDAVFLDGGEGGAAAVPGGRKTGSRQARGFRPLLRKASRTMPSFHCR